MAEKKLVPIVESYNVDEEYLYSNIYIFIKGFATGRKYEYTLKALPLARSIHNGQYRKGLVEIDGKMVQLPYVLHCLKVCSTLISLDLPLTDEELDILYACALLHDTLEDGEEYFPRGGIEFVQDYGFPIEVMEIIRLLSKHSGADEYELNTYFNAIKLNKLALLIKLADRSHNVEDFYNIKNIQGYIDETYHYFIGQKGSKVNCICTYAKQHYPELSNGVTILKSKILSLTEATEALIKRQNIALKGKDEIIQKQEEEIAKLKKELEQLKKATTTT